MYRNYIPVTSYVTGIPFVTYFLTLQKQHLKKTTDIFFSYLGKPRLDQPNSPVTDEAHSLIQNLKEKIHIDFKAVFTNPECQLEPIISECELRLA